MFFVFTAIHLTETAVDCFIQKSVNNSTLNRYLKLNIKIFFLRGGDN